MKSTDDNVVSLDKPGSLGSILKPEADPALVKLCRDTATRHLRQTMQQFFDAVDDSLFALADKVASGEGKEDYLHAMREVRDGRSEVEDRFSTHFFGQYDEFWNPVPERQPLTAGELSLLDEEDLDASLAMSNMVAKGENRFQGPLFELEQRFAELRGGDAPVTVDFNPIAPKALCASFQYAVERLELDANSRMIVFKVFDQEVLSPVGDLYGDVNGLLIQSGILPHISSNRIRKSRSDNSLGSRSDGSTTEELTSRFVGEGQADPNLFASLQQLLTAVRPATGGEGGAGAAGQVEGAGPVQYVQPQAVLTALNALQHTVVAAPMGQGSVSAEDVKLQLRNELHEIREGGQTIGQAEEDTIDVIGMLFEFILEDNNLPDCIRVLIARLQIPILKIGIADKTFFSHKSHPARKLLNELAQAGLAWDEKSGASLYGQIERTVNRVLNEFADDKTILGLILEEFQDYLETERSRARPAEDSIRQVLQGKEELVLARRRVDQELTRWRKGNIIPSPVARLLDEAWSDVLLLVYVRQGDKSPAWAKAVAIVRQLVGSVQPHFEQKDRTRLLQSIPKLLEALRKGLNLISFDKKAREEIFCGLQECHLACMRGETVSSPESDHRVKIALDEAPNGISSIELPLAETAGEIVSEELGVRVVGVRDGIPEEGVPAPSSRGASGDIEDFPSVPGSVIENGEGSSVDSDELEEIMPTSPSGSSHQDDDSAADVDAGLLGVVDGLQTGTWVEFHEDDTESVRAKLAWKSELDAGYLFVNHRGEKVAELTHDEIVQRVRRGTVSVIDDVPLVDRALEFMVTALATETDPPLGQP